MRPGNLRHLVRIEEPTLSSAGAYGGKATTWSLYATARADIRPVSGAKLFAAQAVQSRVDVEIIIRYIDGVTAGMRINHNGTYYNISHVINRNTRDRELLLMCETGLDEG